MREDGQPPPGGTGPQLAGGARLLRPDGQVFAAMLGGWRAQRLARNLAFATISGQEAAGAGGGPARGRVPHGRAVVDGGAAAAVDTERVKLGG
ncbi:MAG: hypothetical protein ACM3ML_30175 [Micromonosporaceae bacterium]